MNLYPYQKEGVAWLASHGRAYLADEMGLGKTVQAVVAARVVKAERPLVVCPASVVEHWKHEWHTWAGKRIEPTVVSYSKLIRAPSCFQCNADLVILDEAHYVKTPSAQRTRTALKLAKAAPRAWLLSGTPVPNDVRELWPPVRYLWPELAERFGIHNAFEWMDRWCHWTQSDYGYRVWGLTRAACDDLVPALRSIMLRRRLEEVALELPPLRFTIERLPYDMRLAEVLAGYATDNDDPEHLATLRRLLGKYKAPAIARQIIDELDNKQIEAVVVLYHHHDTGAILRDAFTKAGYATLGFDGSASSTFRQREIETFQAGFARVFLGQQGAAGIGITLTRASEIVLVEPSWSPEDNAQAIKRIHRIGQDAPCRARMFAVPGSLDAHLMTTLRRKQDMIRTVVDGE